MWLRWLILASRISRALRPSPALWLMILHVLFPYLPVPPVFFCRQFPGRYQSLYPAHGDAEDGGGFVGGEHDYSLKDCFPLHAEPCH